MYLILGIYQTLDVLLAPALFLHLFILFGVCWGVISGFTGELHPVRLFAMVSVMRIRMSCFPGSIWDFSHVLAEDAQSPSCLEITQPSVPAGSLSIQLVYCDPSNFSSSACYPWRWDWNPGSCSSTSCIPSPLLIPTGFLLSSV